MKYLLIWLCVSGMEGGPVFDEQGNLVGMLTRPLRQRGGAAEVQVLLSEIIEVEFSSSVRLVSSAFFNPSELKFKQFRRNLTIY